MKEIQIPSNYSPRDYQLDFLASSKRFKGAIWHRRGGKSKTVFNDQVMKAVRTKGVYYYFLPTYRQAKAVVWDQMVHDHVPDEIVNKKNESELTIYYKNGSIQHFAGCEDIDKHRGINPIDVVFDEYSEMSEEMWTAIIQPVLRENKGSATFIFTPKGKNHAWKLYQKTRDSEDWFWSLKTVDDTGGLAPEEIAAAKKETPEALFRQEYMCSFEEGAGQYFRGIQQCLYEPPNEPVEGDRYQLGVDLAKYQDWTVLTPFNLNTFDVMPQDRFNQVDWNLQKARIHAAARKWNKADVNPDATGVGDPIVEDLKSLGLTIVDDGFKFTETSRAQLLNNLAIMLEQRKIRIPNDPGLIAELESFQYVLGEKGKVKVQAPSGMHDDRVMSLALAIWGHKEPYKIDYNDIPSFRPPSY